MFVVVSYDIPDDRRRLRVSQVLKGFGARVQYSVFECDLSPESFQRLRQKVGKVIERSQDSVRYYRLCAACLKEVIIDGLGEVQTDKEVIII